MNPYEAPQSSLDPEPEKKPRVPVKYQTYDALVMLKILFVIFLVLFEVILGVLLLQRTLHALGFDSNSHMLHFDSLLPYVIIIFLGIGWILWWLRKTAA